jgi:hypothetical protein
VCSQDTRAGLKLQKVETTQNAGTHGHARQSYPLAHAVSMIVERLLRELFPVTKRELVANLATTSQHKVSQQGDYIETCTIEKNAPPSFPALLYRS